MRNKNVVFIVGAGGSIPFGFPSGKELIEKIPRLLMPVEERFNKFLRSKYDHDLLLRLYNKIRVTPISSIDRFLANHVKDGLIQEIGKLCIAYQINQFEGEGVITGKEDNWYAYLFNKLFELANYEPQEIVNVPVNFVTFNYDRSLEYFLFKAFESSFDISGTDAEKLAKNYIARRIIHIHGSLGDIFEHEFRACKGRFEVVESMSKGIRIVHEDDNNEVLRAVQDLLSKTDLVYFIGFGFAKENLEKLWFPKMPQDQRRISIKASRFGIKLGELNDIKNYCYKTKRLRIDFHEHLEPRIPWDLTPHQFMRNCVSLL